jgi:hypothetical protein
LTAASTHRVAVALPAFRRVLARAELAHGRGPDLSAVQWLASRGRRAAGSVPDWRAWLLSQFGPGAEPLRRCPAGPAVRALAIGRRDEGCWACADPVHLVTGLDHLRLAPLADLGLVSSEAQALCDSIAAELAQSGYVLHFSQQGPWLLECPTEIECESVEPADAEGHDLRDCLPTGRDGRAVRKLMNEFQMLLHEHPVNARRVDRGLAAVNALWLWGFGQAQAVEPVHSPMLATDDSWLQGLWKLHGGSGLPLAMAKQTLATADTLLVAATENVADAEAQLAQWDTALAEPLAAALRQGRVHSASLLLGDVPYSVERAARHAFWRRRRRWPELLG